MELDGGSRAWQEHARRVAIVPLEASGPRGEGSDMTALEGGARTVVVTVGSLASLPKLPPRLEALYSPPIVGSVSIRATVFDALNSRFVGSTFVSPSAPLANPGSRLALDIPVVVHTDVVDVRLLLVVELVMAVVHPDPTEPSEVATTEYGLGFALLPFNADVPVGRDRPLAPLYAGTPRALASVPLASVRALPGIASLSWATLALDPHVTGELGPYLPFHHLVSASSTVPGIDLTSIPRPPRPLPYDGLAILSPAVALPHMFEDLFLARVRAAYAHAHNVDAATLGAFAITERRLRVGVHNGLKYLSPPLVVSLEKVASSGTLEFGGTLLLPLVPLDGGIALVTVLELVVQRPPLKLTKKERKRAAIDAPQATKSYGIAWAPLLLSSPGSNGLLHGDVEVQLVPGPSHNPDSRLLYTCLADAHASDASAASNELAFRATLVPGGADDLPPGVDAATATEAELPAAVDRKSSSKRSRRRRRSSRKVHENEELGARGSEYDFTGAPVPLDYPAAPQAQAFSARPPRPAAPRAQMRESRVLGQPLPQSHGSSASAGAFAHLTRADKAALFRAGFPELVDGTGAPAANVSGAEPGPLSASELARESSDVNNVSTVHIQFLAYASEPGAERIGAGSRLYFTLQFYSFPLTETQQVALGADGEVPEDGHPSVLWKMSSGGQRGSMPGLDLSFCVDPGFMRPHEAGALAGYLATKAVQITVWDAASRMALGDVHVPLRALLRAGRSAVAFTDKVPVVYETEIDESPAAATRGFLFVRLGNVGSMSEGEAVGPYDPTSVAPAGLRPPGSGTVFEVARPMREVDEELDLVLKQRAAKDGSRLDSRLDAVDKALASAMGRSVLEARAGNAADLKTVALFRERRKRLTLLSKLSAALTAEHRLYPVFGETLFFEYELVNPFDEPQVFAVAHEVENLTVVTDYNEWLHCKRTFGVDTPAERRYMEKAGGVVSIHLDPHERVYIPFRYQAWDEVQAEPFTGKVEFVDARGRPAAVLQLHVAPQATPADRTLRFYGAEGEYLKRTLPLLGVPRSAVKYLRASREDVVCGVRSDPAEVYFKLAVGAAPSKTTFVLVVYDDEYMISVHGVWRVEVTAAVRDDVVAVLGQESTRSLAVRGGSHPRQVALYTSHPSILRPEAPWGEAASLTANALNEVGLVFKPAAPASIGVVAHMVDVERREVVGAWIVHAAGKQPVLSKTFAVRLGLDVGSRKHVSYRNSSRSVKKYALHTSRPELVDVEAGSDELVIGPGESGTIALVFRPQRTSMAGVRVFVFINDAASGKNVECLGIDLTYG
ncbi:nephrocystin-4 [Thecamonas trahens ATCC 50062]|uniref:Nephrocystin-4 n=1 Tax=Thecamonas trahens ATCC 50062 TaxID=461836 RepID=A0A0L0DQ14_THETB|nr:nephrocystin-4 [Thecamonas trahens ATCC 50062]KNC53518.1 nephrocystin-4 [Thecamonas trahens ATCC 50062]|eukprot:XP_013761839.1 nephrocystin-4 [Thecamonas trahens ATCC 50062]